MTNNKDKDWGQDFFGNLTRIPKKTDKPGSFKNSRQSALGSIRVIRVQMVVGIEFYLFLIKMIG